MSSFDDQARLSVARKSIDTASEDVFENNRLARALHARHVIIRRQDKPTDNIMSERRSRSSTAEHVRLSPSLAFIVHNRAEETTKHVIRTLTASSPITSLTFYLPRILICSLNVQRL